MTCLVFVALGLSIDPAVADTAELQRRLQQQERHIESLEREIEDLKYQLGEQQQRGEVTLRQGMDDPLVGTWQCSNGVFVYEMTFFDNGRLLQETPTFGNLRQGSWQRTGDDEILLHNGMKLRTSFSSANDMIVENVHATELAKWECQKNQQ